MAQDSFYYVNDNPMWTADGINWGAKFYPWSDVLGLQKKLWVPFPVIKTIQGNLSLFSDPEGSDIHSFFQAWKSAEPHRAQKAAFTYAEGSRSFYRIFLVFSLFFSMSLMIFLGRESIRSYECTKALQDNPQTIDATILKRKKKSETHHLLRFSFIDPNSQSTIIGNDQWIGSGNNFPEKSVPLWVAKNDAHCWMIAPKDGELNLAWAKRRFFTAYSGMFSLFFFCFGAFGIFYSIARIREIRPGSEKILADFR